MTALKALFGKLSLPLAAALVIVLAAGWLNRLTGTIEAQSKTITATEKALEASRRDLEEARKTLEKTRGEILENHRENVRILEILEKRVADNAHTTGELKHELAKTASDRALCRFPDPVMQRIGKARTRASVSASGGLDAALPGTGDHE